MFFDLDVHGAKAIRHGVAVLRQQQQPAVSSSFATGSSPSQ